ncbi:hypothetical protein CTheo_97 [Ceratobasidium theobromae]|uniref:Uncharacterized protein n=1 Tax=Ceratobasidium theobromae TaxID=1582974 RepID=A0A5N5QXJ4_9AGAM|nr:hypothetical protein CTheo_97 [Ceratobasidium theobromae]
MNPPTIQTENLSPGNTIQRDQSLPAPAVPPSSPSLPRLPSQVFDSPSLDISISTILAANNTSEPEVAQRASKVIQLSQENSELTERLRQVEQRLKAVQEQEERKRNAMTATR